MVRCDAEPDFPASAEPRTTAALLSMTSMVEGADPACRITFHCHPRRASPIGDAREGDPFGKSCAQSETNRFPSRRDAKCVTTPGMTNELLQ